MLNVVKQSVIMLKQHFIMLNVDLQIVIMPNVVKQCHYAECHHAECRNVIKQSVIMLNVSAPFESVGTYFIFSTQSCRKYGDRSGSRTCASTR